MAYQGVPLSTRLARLWRSIKFPPGPSTATAIAVLALLVSVTQCGLNVPLLTRYYFRPDLVVTGASPHRFGEKAFPTENYSVSNDGNAAATKVEIGFIVLPDERVAVIPGISATVVEQKDPAIVKYVRVELERLAPRERFSVLILPGPNTKRDEMGNNDKSAKGGRFPAFSFVRAAEGPGRYVAAEGQPDFWGAMRR